MSASSKPILLLGLGNDIIADDAIGLLLARQARERFPDHPLIEVVDTCEMGLSLLDFITGHECLLVVDSVQTGQAPPGHIHAVREADLKTLPGMSPHFLGVGEILVLGRTLGLPMPNQVKILAIEIADGQTITTDLSPALQAAWPQLVARVIAELEQLAAARSGV